MSIINRRSIFLLLGLLLIGVFVLIFDSDDTSKKNEQKEQVDSVDKSTSINKNQTITKSKSFSPRLDEKILAQKKKIQDAKVLHENILKTRKEYLLKQSQQHSKYLSHKARYSSETVQRVKQKIKSIKIEKEKQHRKNYEQYTTGKRFEQRSQVHKRTELEKTRLKSLTNIQKKQLLYQKYKKE